MTVNIIPVWYVPDPFGDDLYTIGCFLMTPDGGVWFVPWEILTVSRNGASLPVLHLRAAETYRDRLLQQNEPPHRPNDPGDFISWAPGPCWGWSHVVHDVQVPEGEEPREWVRLAFGGVP